MDKIDKALSTNATESYYLPSIKAASTIGTCLLTTSVTCLMSIKLSLVCPFDTSLLYTILDTTTVLHPFYKLGYLEKAGQPKDWVTNAVEVIKQKPTQTYIDLNMAETLTSSQQAKVCYSTSFGNNKPSDCIVSVYSCQYIQ